MTDVLRPITSLPLHEGTVPAQNIGAPPKIEWVDPRSLSIEEKYQRNLSDRSIALIQRIIAEWNWAHMKPPICARLKDKKLVVIDGQHTAIGAASHPGIDKIPVIIVDTASIKDRAATFVSHNRNRVAMTAQQIYYAALAAEEPKAVVAGDACAAAGVIIRRSMPVNGVWKIGETMSSNAIMTIAGARGVDGTAKILKILVAAERAPISTMEVRAVEAVYHDREWGGAIDQQKLIAVIRSRTAVGWNNAAQSVRRKTYMPLWRALAVAWVECIPCKRGA